MWNAGGACGGSGHAGIVGRCTGCFGGQEVPRGTPRRSLCSSGVQETVLEAQGEVKGSLNILQVGKREPWRCPTTADMEGKRVPRHWGSCFWGAWVQIARGWGSLVMLGGTGEAWGSQTEVGLQEGFRGPKCRGGSGRGWPFWGCRRGPAPRGGHTAAPAHLQPLLFGHLPLVLLVRLVPDEDFLDTIGCVLARGTV